MYASFSFNSSFVSVLPLAGTLEAESAGNAKHCNHAGHAMTDVSVRTLVYGNRSAGPSFARWKGLRVPR